METTQELRRLQYATSNFFALQGLRQVAAGIMMLFVIPILSLNAPWNAWLFLPLLALLGICWWRIGIYYEHRFGSVKLQTRVWTWPDGGSMLKRGLFWGGVIALYLFAAKALQVNLSPQWFFGFLFLAFFVIEGRRWYYLPFAVSFFALTAFNPVSHPLLLAASLWLMPVGLIITGILDHRLLVRSLPGVQRNGAA